MSQKRYISDKEENHKTWKTKWQAKTQYNKKAKQKIKGK